eukprot:5340628-Amphidinium_carterae.1
MEAHGHKKKTGIPVFRLICLEICPGIAVAASELSKRRKSDRSGVGQRHGLSVSLTNLQFGVRSAIALASNPKHIATTPGIGNKSTAVQSFIHTASDATTEK